MRFRLFLENASGERVNMTSTQNEYMVSEITGLYPPSATLSTTGYAGADGSYLTNAYIEKRNVVITFQMRGVGIEKRRQTLYSIVQPSKYIKIYYRTPRRNVWAEGYVETLTVSNFTTEVNGQISILCPDIYWYSTKSTTVSTADDGGVEAGFHFEIPNEDWADYGEDVLQTYMGEITASFVEGSASLTIENDGDEIGFILRLLNTSEESFAIRAVTITNEATGATFIISGASENIDGGGYWDFDFRVGHKHILVYDSDGEVTSLLGYLDVANSDWLTLINGTNKITVTVTTSAETDALEFEIIHTNAYLGV